MEAPDRAALWTLGSIFVVFKVATTLMIILFAPAALWPTVWLFLAFHWPFILAGLLAAAAPALFWWRLVRVRSRRAQLQASEWNVESTESHPHFIG